MSRAGSLAKCRTGQGGRRTERPTIVAWRYRDLAGIENVEKIRPAGFHASPLRSRTAGFFPSRPANILANRRSPFPSERLPYKVAAESNTSDERLSEDIQALSASEFGLSNNLRIS